MAGIRNKRRKLTARKPRLTGVVLLTQLHVQAMHITCRMYFICILCVLHMYVYLHAQVMRIIYVYYMCMCTMYVYDICMCVCYLALLTEGDPQRLLPRVGRGRTQARRRKRARLRSARGRRR